RDVCARYDLDHSQVQQFLGLNNRKPKPRAHVTGALLQRAIHMYKSTRVSRREVAAEIGVSENELRGAFEKAGVKGRSRKLFNKRETKQIGGMYRRIKSYPKVARMIGCSDEAVRDVLHRNQVKLQPKRKIDSRSEQKIKRLYFSLTPKEIAK